MILKSIEESQQEFLRDLKIIFGEWKDFEWNKFVSKNHLFKSLVENYYKNILIHLPFPIGRLVFENFINDITAKEMYKYFRLNRMHTFNRMQVQSHA